jgi:hypothetical protein
LPSTDELSGRCMAELRPSPKLFLYRLFLPSFTPAM